MDICANLLFIFDNLIITQGNTTAQGNTTGTYFILHTYFIQTLP
jgi:hypothetical protein